MRVVIQRAKNAKCTVEGQVTGQIDHGYCIFVGFNNEDTEEIIAVSYTHLTLPTKA